MSLNCCCNILHTKRSMDQLFICHIYHVLKVLSGIWRSTMYIRTGLVNHRYTYFISILMYNCTNFPKVYAPLGNCFDFVKIIIFIIHPCDPTVVICYLIWPCDLAVCITYLISHSSSLGCHTIIKGYFRLGV